LLEPLQCVFELTRPIGRNTRKKQRSVRRLEIARFLV
jgi:hypothetical protein